MTPLPQVASSHTQEPRTLKVRNGPTPSRIKSKKRSNAMLESKEESNAKLECKKRSNAKPTFKGRNLLGRREGLLRQARKARLIFQARLRQDDRTVYLMIKTNSIFARGMTAKGISSHIMYSSISFGRSTTPKNRQLDMIISDSKQQVDGFVGGVDLIKLIDTYIL